MAPSDRRAAMYMRRPDLGLITTLTSSSHNGPPKALWRAKDILKIKLLHLNCNEIYIFFQCLNKINRTNCSQCWELLPVYSPLLIEFINPASIKDEKDEHLPLLANKRSFRCQKAEHPAASRPSASATLRQSYFCRRPEPASDFSTEQIVEGVHMQNKTSVLKINLQKLARSYESSGFSQSRGAAPVRIHRPRRRVLTDDGAAAGGIYGSGNHTVTEHQLWPEGERGPHYIYFKSGTLSFKDASSAWNSLIRCITCIRNHLDKLEQSCVRFMSHMQFHMIKVVLQSNLQPDWSSEFLLATRNCDHILLNKDITEENKSNVKHSNRLSAPVPESTYIYI